MRAPRAAGKLARHRRGHVISTERSSNGKERSTSCTRRPRRRKTRVSRRSKKDKRGQGHVSKTRSKHAASGPGALSDEEEQDARSTGAEEVEEDDEKEDERKGEADEEEEDMTMNDTGEGEGERNCAKAGVVA